MFHTTECRVDVIHYLPINWAIISAKVDYLDPVNQKIALKSSMVVGGCSVLFSSEQLASIKSAFQAVMNIINGKSNVSKGVVF